MPTSNTAQPQAQAKAVEGRAVVNASAASAGLSEVRNMEISRQRMRTRANSRDGRADGFTSEESGWSTGGVGPEERARDDIVMRRRKENRCREVVQRRERDRIGERRR